MSLTNAKMGSLGDKHREQEQELAALAKAAEKESKKLKVGDLKPHRSKLTKPRK